MRVAPVGLLGLQSVSREQMDSRTLLMVSAGDHCESDVEM
jgi:hypothetical protein